MPIESTCAANPTRTRAKRAHISRHPAEALEMVAVESDGTSEYHLTIAPRRLEPPEAVARRAAGELNAREATAVRVLAYGSISAQPATVAALRLWLDDEDLPVTWVEGASCDGQALAGLQIHAIAGAEVHTLKGVPARARVWEDGQATHCVISSLGPTDVSVTPAEQAAETFCALQAGLAEAGMTMKHVARTWFYLDDILSWYGDFNRVRNDFFTRHEMPLNNMPASTGVRGRNPAGAALTAAVWAVRPHDPSAQWVRAVASPGQCPAPAYGSAFSRAVEITSAGFRQLLISGTASIAPGGLTCCLGDVPGQIDRTMEVVEAILASRRMTLADVSRAIAYFKSPKEAPLLARWLERHKVAALPLINVHCDICRGDLLFEIELDALQAGGPML